MVYVKEVFDMKVKRVEQQFIRKNHQLYEIVDRYCLYSKNVYNEANYLIRQAFINENKILSAYDVQAMMQDMDCYKECGSQAAQKSIQLVAKEWKGFFKASKAICIESNSSKTNLFLANSKSSKLSGK